MHFEFRTFQQVIRLIQTTKGEVEIPLTSKRILFLAFFLTLYPLFEIFNAACFLLDDLLFPRWRKAELRMPVFIIGNPRSGTTFLHRLLAMDRDRFFAFLTWELIFPAIIQKKTLAMLGYLDRITGGRIARKIENRERRLFDEFDKIHRIGLFSPEEDDKLFIHNCSFHGLMWFFPYQEFSKFHKFDMCLAPEERTRIMAFYRDCLKRQAYFKGAGKSLLSKNPVSSLKVDSLLHWFPDCRIIYLVRNPLEVVASTLNMAQSIWKRTAGVERDDDVFQNTVYEIVKLFYEYPLSRLQREPEHVYRCIRYEDLVREPKRVVEGLYEWLGFDMNPEYRSALEEEDLKSRRYTSEHIYSLDRFMIRPEQIRSDLDAILKRFGYVDGDPSVGA
ncbi:MAG: sulfotransferase [Thermodesulfobacteriota bacterium]